MMTMILKMTTMMATMTDDSDDEWQVVTMMTVILKMATMMATMNDDADDEWQVMTMMTNILKMTTKMEKKVESWGHKFKRG